jgi:hypothetical protein
MVPRMSGVAMISMMAALIYGFALASSQTPNFTPDPSALPCDDDFTMPMLAPRKPYFPGKTGKHKWSCDPNRTVWAQCFVDEPTVNTPGSLENTKFRERFNMTKATFDEVVAATRASGQFADDMKKPKHGGTKAHPLNFKVMACLAHVADATPYTSMKDCCGINGSTLQHFAADWVPWFVDKYYDDWVHPPRTTVELRAAEALYAAAGFPGRFGSMDGVRFAWDGAPYADRSIFVGKEGFPTVAFNVHVGHNKRILHISEPYGGSRNDKTMVLGDKLVQAIREDDLYTKYTFQLYNRDGVLVQKTGAGVICDGGYHEWLCTMCPVKYGITTVERRWSKRLESVRKDVECVFGRLKKRFTVLKMPFPSRVQFLVPFAILWTPSLVRPNFV